MKGLSGCDSQIHFASGACPPAERTAILKEFAGHDEGAA